MHVMHHVMLATDGIQTGLGSLDLDMSTVEPTLTACRKCTHPDCLVILRITEVHFVYEIED